MSAPIYGTETLIKAARAAAEAFITTLDEATGHAPPASGQGPDDLTEYDPLHDEPPFAPNPAPSAPEAQQRLATITYLGAIGRINAEEGRGATSEEISEFAKKAGYAGGNAVNGWNSRSNSPRAVENLDGARFLNETGLKWVTKESAKLGIKVVGDVAAVSSPDPARAES